MSAAEFHEDWFGEASCVALADLLGRTEGVAGAVVEVGSWEGRSTIALANAAHPEMVHAVDTWQGSPGEISAELAAQRDVFATFRANVAAETKGNVWVHRTDWRAYFDDHREPVRFLFIDAEHTYDEVRDTIAATLPLLEPGAIICGDDVHHPPVQQAVIEAFPDAQRVATLWWWQKPGPETLQQEYERLCATPSDIYLHLPRFVELVRERNAQQVVELGTRSGVSTVAWLYGLAETGGHLTSVDLERAPFGPRDGWTFHQANDLDPALLAELPDADIVFLDTSHLYEQTLVELRIYQHMVRRPGLIVCHDTMLERPEGAPPRPRFPVRVAVEEFCADEGYEFTLIPECWGLAIIRIT